MAGTNGATADAAVSTEQLVMIADQLKMYVQGQGQATRKEIRDYATKGLNVSQDVYSKAWAILHNGLKLTTEVARENGEKAFEIKRNYYEVPAHDLYEQFGEAKKTRESYKDWYVVTGTMTLLSECLSSRPVAGNESQRSFLMADADHVFLSDIYFKKMFQVAAEKPGMPAVGNGRFNVQFDPILIDAAGQTTVLNPVPPDRLGMAGKGLTQVAALPVGYKIPFAATVPGSHIPPEWFAAIMTCAGKWVGFSPSAAHKGWGRFIVHIDEGQRTAN